MSGYNGRRGPNVSQYVAQLNTVSSPTEFLPDPLDLENDLALFTGNDFVDWNAGDGNFNPSSSTLDLDNINVEQLSSTRPRSKSVSKNAPQSKMDDFDLVGGDFQFADFSNFQDSIVNQPMQQLSQSQAGAYPVQHSYTSPVSTSVSPVTPQFDQSGKKRKLEVETQSQHAIDEAARVAAEEDKRRRNTAASARFRIKKKQREQALEKTAKEMSERVRVLETRVQQLETENTWLKGLITEKNAGKSSNTEISAMLKKHVEENAGERSSGNRTDGVGTESKEPKA